MPRAAARSRRSRKVLLMIDRVVGKINAAKVPIANRVATSAPAEVTKAPAALATAKPPRRGDQGPGRAGDREAHQPDDERRAPADTVRQRPGGQHQPGEREVVT